MKTFTLAQTLFLVLCTSVAVAEWQPGLRYGLLPYNNNSDFKPEENLTEWEAVSYPVDADTKSHWPTAKGSKGLMVYQGQIYLEAGVYWFVESADDGARLAIGGTEILKDASWSNPVLKRFVVEAPGWYDFDLRFTDGGGGYGPAKSGWWTRSDIAFGWKRGDENGSSADADNKVPDAYSVPKNEAGATLDNCLFRCDDGLGFADEVSVSQLPFPIPVSFTPSVRQSGLSANDQVSFSSDSSYTAPDGSMRASLAGHIISNIVSGAWTLREETTDAATSFTYTHDGYPNSVYWTWAVQYKLTTAADEGGSVDVATGWFDKDTTVTLTANHPSKPFTKWIGDITPELATLNPLTIPMNQARSLTAHFGNPEVFVDAVNGNDTTGLGTEDAPYKTFATAMAFTANGFSVYLRPGTYTVTAETVINDAVSVIGLGDSPADVVIKGNQSFRIFTLNNKDALLSNLTVSHGKLSGGSGSSHPLGGNVLISTNGGTVTNCILCNCACVAWGEGGAVAINSPDGLVSHCVITNNIMTDGNMQGGTAVAVNAGRIEYSLIARNIDRVDAAPNNKYLGAIRMNGGEMDYCTVVENLDYSDTIYVNTGASVCHTVFARNHNLYNEQSGQINATAAVMASAFTNCVWDLGDISETCPRGDVKFVDFASGDYRLARDSAGAFADGHDWGCFDVADADRVDAAAEPETITVAPGGDIRDALKRVKDGGKVILQAGNHTVSGNALMVVRGITVCGETADNTATKIKLSGTLNGSLVVLSHANALLTGVTVTDNTSNTGGNNAANGITILQDGGTVSNCVIRNMKLVSNAHAGVGVRLGRAGAHLTCCVISNIETHANTAYGGAVALMAADTLIDNCLLMNCFCDNWASGGGHKDKDTPGAFYQANGTIANCTIADCHAERKSVIRTAGGIFRDSIVWGCTFGNQDVGSIATGNGVKADNWINVFSDYAEDGAVWQTVTEDQIMFVNADAGDFRIKGASIAKNSGDTALTPGESPVDLDGNPRLFGSRLDAGCYECQQSDALMLLLR